MQLLNIVYSLMDVVELLIENHVHRLPVFESPTVCDEILSWIGWKQILKSLQKQVRTHNVFSTAERS